MNAGCRCPTGLRAPSTLHKQCAKRVPLQNAESLGRCIGAELQRVVANDPLQGAIVGTVAATRG